MALFINNNIYYLLRDQVYLEFCGFIFLVFLNIILRPALNNKVIIEFAIHLEQAFVL